MPNAPDMIALVNKLSDANQQMADSFVETQQQMSSTLSQITTAFSDAKKTANLTLGGTALLAVISIVGSLAVQTCDAKIAFQAETARREAESAAAKQAGEQSFRSQILLKDITPENLDAYQQYVKFLIDQKIIKQEE
jgi:hypothetical protein